jgi:hypothetical protein
VINHKHPFVLTSTVLLSFPFTLSFLQFFRLCSMLLTFSFLIIFFLSCTVHLTKACDSYSLYFSSHLYRNLIFVAVYLRVVSSLLRSALLNARTTITHGGQTDRFYYAACYVNQTVVGLNERSPADHEPIIHCAVK